MRHACCSAGGRTRRLDARRHHPGPWHRVKKEPADALQDVMTPEVEVIAPEASIHEVAEKMSHRDIGPLPVCDGERLVGMLTDRDITVRAVAAAAIP